MDGLLFKWKVNGSFLSKNIILKGLVNLENYTFHDKLFSLLSDSLRNYYTDNFDEERFGNRKKNFFIDVRKKFFSSLFPNLIKKKSFVDVTKKVSLFLEEYGQRLEQVYMVLENNESKDWLVRMVAYKILGHEKIKLPTNTPVYFSIRDSQKKYLNYDQFVEVFLSGNKKKLYLADLSQMGINMKVYSAGLDHIFIHQQHKYKDIVVPQNGDVVLDCGACYGDSCLYFANLVGQTGRVYSFEFIPNHVEVFKENLKLNPSLEKVANLIEAPLWEKKGVKVYFKDDGPGSRVDLSMFDGYQGVIETLTIDSFCEECGVDKVDYIKMDIEGSELFALKGGERIIRKHRPKLAISSYHSLEDFVNIPLWIDSLGLGYKIYLDHTTIHWEETSVFAIATK